MKKATRKLAEVHGEKYPLYLVPLDEEIGAICLSCQKFTPIRYGR
jgi:hypothetical protein